MSFEYLVDPEKGPQWKGVLPGRPAPYVLRRGEGEHAMLFTDVFTVLLSGDETDGQFGVITADCPPGKLIPTHAHSGTHETIYTSRARSGSSSRTTRVRRPTSCSSPATSPSCPPERRTPTASRRRPGSPAR